ncbi:hypothetical protein LRP49_11400 [Enterovibrio sp. ZSDZ35]|uniref:N-acetyltransferase domain-containing protein n=1 Tax=Enterovibrio qingdaonensis TaxID=2899818 RepID=A0ABT5QLF1_9GAMM|nr:hypothetical protein [Enterovibrio sp. ZSDZ35]MDD1781796.1 hypothetical protein [Enterovibrio sp. ZSDZ35]
MDNLSERKSAARIESFYLRTAPVIWEGTDDSASEFHIFKIDIYELETEESYSLWVCPSTVCKVSGEREVFRDFENLTLSDVTISNPYPDRNGEEDIAGFWLTERFATGRLSFGPADWFGNLMPHERGKGLGRFCTSYLVNHFLKRGCANYAVETLQVYDDENFRLRCGYYLASGWEIVPSEDVYYRAMCSSLSQLKTSYNRHKIDYLQAREWQSAIHQFEKPC